MIFSFLVLIGCFITTRSTVNADTQQCGYKSCNLGKPGMLNVHMVPHTHDDVGWLKTVDQYLYGAHNEIQNAGVQYILDSVIRELRESEKRRFIYVEVAFFARWWRQQYDPVRHLVKRLVNEGRLEFILGGWCMNDEAATHYNAIIDQHTVGFRFLQENFGECGRPRVGWQIDPFGHSREQASLFAQFGFDGLFFGRLDYQDKARREITKTMELMWLGSENLGDQASLFTGVNQNGYSPPPGFCFDVNCRDPPMMDDKRLHDYNVPQKVSDFINYVENQASHYSTNHIQLTMGSDFQFQNANQNYKNIEKLMKYVNMEQSNGSRVNTFYSTPSCYLYALNQVNQTYQSKADDFFPYADHPHAFWTGYFTSRPALKGYVRSTNNLLQACKQLDVISQLGPEFNSNYKINKLKEAMGVAQHHDAVSGTEKQAVAYDYAERLADGIKECEDVMSLSLTKLMSLSNSEHQVTFCPLLNVSYCTPTETSKQFSVVVYNPVGRSYSYWVRVPVPQGEFAVYDPQMKHVNHQLTPLSNVTTNLPDHNGSVATQELVFEASLPALGFSVYTVKSQGLFEKVVPKQNSAPDVTNTGMENEYLKIEFDPSSGLLKSVTNKKSNQSVSLEQSLFYYLSYQSDSETSSGAYIFRPNSSEAFPVSENVTTTFISGTLVQEVHQNFGSWASQVTRLYSGQSHFEIEWTVGPLPETFNGKEWGHEVISRFSTDMKSEATFYTDSNGRELLKRVRDYRPTWKLYQTEPVAGNYYPVNSRIALQDTDEQTQLTVLTDRSQGGSSINDGQLELMLHRRMFYNDGYGVGEALNEPGIDGKGLRVRGKHYVIFDSIKSSAKLHRDLGEKLFMAPVLGFLPSALNTSKINLSWSGVTKNLPDNVHLLTLEQWTADTYLIRVEHFYEKGEDPTLSQPVSVSLKKLFSPFTVDSAEELTLGANQKLSDAKRLQWNVKGVGRTHADMSKFVVPVEKETLTVELKPMQIRTFKITLV